MKPNRIPSELRNVIDSEQTDFIVKSSRNHPRKNGLALLFFSLFWNGFVSIFVIAFIVPILSGQELNFTSNGVPTSASSENWEPILVPSLVIGLFVLVGIAMFFWSLVLLLQKGGYFAGTETRLIKFRKGEITVTDWEQFTGNIKMKNKSDVGDLEFQLRTGKMIKRKKGADRFVPDIIYISGIKNVFDIEKKCRIRIKENDPTPKISTRDSAYD